MARRFYLGLDQGTTGTMTLLLDHCWNVAARGYWEHPLIMPRDGWVEQDPEMLWHAALDATRDALQQGGVSGEELACIGLDNQGETCLIWERDSGCPIYPAIVWQDRRTAAKAERLGERYGAVIRERTGLLADSYFSATKLQWILDRVPGARRRAEAGQLAAGTLDTWLLWKMTGGRVHATDLSTASRTMLMNLRTGQWDDRMLEITEVPREILPEICPSAHLYGYTDPSAFLGLSVPISGSAADQQAALFGQGCHQSGMVKTTYGTGCFLLMNTGERPILSENGLLTTVAWGLGGPMTYALDGGVYVAGSAVHWLRDRMRLVESAEETGLVARRTPDNGGVYFVPAFVGLAAPHWDPYARGTIVGLHAGSTREHLIRATLESIAYQVYDNLAVMRRDSALPVEMMRVDGGMVQNDFLMQFQADLLGIPIDVPAISETTALGAAYLAAVGVGEFRSLDELSAQWRLARRYEPRMSQDQRQSLLDCWRRAVERSRGWLTGGTTPMQGAGSSVRSKEETV